MITSVHIKNFKCFTDLKLDLAPITVLAGLNSSGKSTVLQALRMWGQRGLLSEYGPEEGLRSSLGGAYSICVTCHNGEASTLFDVQHTEHDDEADYVVLQRRQPVYFIGASRLGPQTFLPLRVSNDNDHVGENGEYIVDILRRHLLGGSVSERLRRNVKLAGVRDNINGWLQELSPGVTFDYHPTVEADIGRTEFSSRRPANVGYGLSYVLPIVVSVLSLSSNAMKRTQPEDIFLPVLLIENPEAHLHPRGQTMMGRFLAYAAACGVQCVVETHSEHILNGIRLAIKEDSLEAHNAVAYFFEYSFSEEKTSVQPIFFNKYGGCDNWPDGFFDESEKTLLELV